MEDINVTQLKEKLDNKEEFVLIDVREQHEHDEFNVGGQLIPVNTLPYNFEKLTDHKEDEIVVYCRSGARSGMAKQLLEQQGFKKVRNLTGGMLAWKDAYQ